MANKAEYVDQYLTGIAQGWFNKREDYIANKLFPTVTVPKSTFLVPEFGKDNTRLPDSSVRTGASEPKNIGYTRSMKPGQPIIEHSLADMVYDNDRDESDEPYRPETDTLENLLSVMELIDEKALSSLVTDTSIVTNNTTLSAESQWSDYDHSEPLKDIITAANTALFEDFNTLVIGKNDYHVLVNHPALRDYVKWSQPGPLTRTALLSILGEFGIHNILIGTAKENVGREGLADDFRRIWSGDVLLAYVTPTPGRKVLNGGYKFAKKDARQVTSEYKNSKKATEIIVTDEYNYELFLPECYHLFKNAFAQS